ncbi:cytochrome C5 [Nocardioides sp. WV_118_6]
MEIQHLVDAVAPLLREPAAEEDFVYGLAAFPATGTDVMINVDPELEDRTDVEVPALVDRVAAFLALSPEQWEALVTRTVTEIEEAAGEVAVPVALREDLDLTSVVVFIDAVLLSFIAPLQLPDGIVRVQLDADLAFEDIEVQIEDGTETVTFDSMDDLLDHISRED